MSLDSQLERDFNFQVVSSSPGTKQISVILKDPTDKVSHQNDLQNTGHVSIAPACIKTNHLRYTETPTSHNQKNVAIARCTSLWSSKPKYVPKRLQPRCCLHPPRCINCPVIRNHCDGIIPVSFNTSCSSNLADGSPKILILESTSSVHSSTGYKMTSPKTMVMPKQITSFPKQIIASPLSSCFQKNSMLDSSSCCQDLSDNSEVSESTSRLPSFFQQNQAQKYACYYPNSCNEYQLPKSKPQQLCQHMLQQYSTLKQKPLYVDHKQQKPQESHVVTYNSQSCDVIKNSESRAVSDGLPSIHKQNAEELQHISCANHNAGNTFPAGRLYSQANMNYSLSDSNVAILHNIPNNMNLFTSFQSSLATEKPLQDVQLMMNLAASDTVRRDIKNFEPTNDSLEKLHEVSPSYTETSKTTDLSPKVNHSIPTETSARSNSSSDSRLSFEFSLEAERMVSSLCSSTPVKENQFTESEKTEQPSEPIARFLTFICHSGQTNQNRILGSKHNTGCFSTTNTKYNVGCNSDLSGSNVNVTEFHSTPNETFGTMDKENKFACKSQVPSVNENVNGRESFLPEESIYSKSCCSETFQASNEEIKRSFIEYIREEETLFKKSALRGCYEISYILSESFSPGFDGIESFRKNVVEIISKADTIFGKRCLLRDVVIGFLQLANCWANLYSCIGLRHEGLQHSTDLHELFWNWTCASRKLMSGFNTFFEQQSSVYAKQKANKGNSAQEERHDYHSRKHANAHKDRICTLASDSGSTLSNAPERSKQSYMTSSENRSSFCYPLKYSGINNGAVEIGTLDTTKTSPCQHNQLPHWGAKSFPRGSLEKPSYKSYGNMSKNKRYYYDNSKRSHYTQVPKYVFCQDRSTPTCAMSKGGEFQCLPSCTSSLSADSVIKQKGCCQASFSSTSQQRIAGCKHAETAFGRQVGNTWQQLQNEQHECNDKEKSNKYPHVTKINNSGNHPTSGSATPENNSHYIDFSAVLKNANIGKLPQVLQDNNNGNSSHSINNEHMDIQKSMSLKCINMSHGDTNENQLIWKDDKASLNNKVHVYNVNPYSTTKNGNIALPALKDDPDSSEELEELVYMKPGSYQVPKKQSHCPNNSTTQFWKPKDDTKVSSQAQIGISLPVMQNLQSPISSIYNINQMPSNKDVEPDAISFQLKSTQNECKTSPDLAWKAACASAETLLETLRGNSITSISTYDEQSGLNNRESNSPICKQKLNACDVKNLETEERSPKGKQEKQENQRMSTPTADKRKNNVRTDDWLIHTLNNISKPKEHTHISQETETVTAIENEKADAINVSCILHTSDNTKSVEKSKHNEHAKTTYHAKQAASKSNAGKSPKDGRSAEERPTPRARKGASGSSGKKSQTQYYGGERNNSSSRKRKLQERTLKDDESTNHNFKDNSLRTTNSGSSRKNKPDLRNKASWNVWYSSRRRRGLSQMAVDKLESILNTIWNMEESEFVKYTIDSSKVRDYYKCVKHPMFLETIANKLKNRIYETIEHFVHDLRRVFFNAKLYNKEDAFHYKLIKILETKLNFLLDEHFSGWDLSYITGIPTEVANIPALRYLSYIGDGSNSSKSRRSKVSNKAPSSPRKGASTTSSQNN